MKLALVALVSLAGCASLVPHVSVSKTPPAEAAKAVPPEVKVVSVPCTPPTMPSLPGDLLTSAQASLIAEGPQRFIAISADWLRRVAWDEQAGPVVEACRPRSPP